MKLTVLGCGASTGVPVVGCRCPVCTSPEPRNSRLRTSLLITAGAGRNVLIDAGPDLRQQALRAGLERLDAVLCTHAHADHTLGLDDLRAFSLNGRGPLPLYAAAATLAGLRESFRYILEPNPRYEGGLITQLATVTVEYFTPFSAAGLRCTPFPLQHGSSTVTGFFFGSFAYATDCNGIPPESRALLRGVPLLILDGLGYKKHATHFSIPEAAAVAAELQAAATRLVHMTHTVDYDQANLQLPPAVQLAYDGLELEVPDPI